MTLPKRPATKQMDSAKRSTSVPGVYLGFSLQTTRLLYHLLNCKRGAIVSLEVFGDTAIETSSGLHTEEIKSRRSDNNPIADRSEELWKTIRNWVDGINNGLFDISKTQFYLYVTREFEGEIASAFSAANSHSSALDALDTARRTLISSAEDTPTKKANAVSPKVQRHIDVVFNSDPEVVAGIIQRFHLEFGTGTSFDDLTVSKGTRFVAPHIMEPVLEGALGWVKRVTDAQIENGEPARISEGDFATQFIALNRLYDREDYLMSVAGDPSADLVGEQLNTPTTYLRQLELIGADHDDKVRAVTDFMKATTDRTKWAEAGRVFESSFNSFEDELLVAWKNYKTRNEIANKTHEPHERGRLLYADCTAHAGQATLNGLGVPEHFCRGSFHKLSDSRDIGWHPEFAKLLPSLSEET